MRKVAKIKEALKRAYRHKLGLSWTEVFEISDRIGIEMDVLLQKIDHHLINAESALKMSKGSIPDKLRYDLLDQVQAARREIKDDQAS